MALRATRPFSHGARLSRSTCDPSTCTPVGGSRLLQASLDALSAEGFASVCLWVLEGNAAARAFYERCGFVCNGDVLDVEVGGAPLREVRYVRALERTNATRPHS